jgi:SAM-dependent methyltransferase
LSKATVESFEYQWKTLPKGDFLLSDESWRKNVDDYILDELQMTRDRIRGMKVLDAGCGQGWWSLDFEKLGCRICGFDITPSAVRSTRMNVKGRFDVGSVLDKGRLDALYGAERFDLVWCWGVLHHTPDPKRGFDNLTALLAPKGLIHIYVYGMKGPVSRFWRWIFGRFGLAIKERLARVISRIGLWLQRTFNRKNPPVVGRLLRRLFPAYTPHTIFDAFSPRIASEHTQREVKAWFQSNGLAAVFHRPSWGGSRTSTDIWATGWKK